MRCGLLLIDLQQDYLDQSELRPDSLTLVSAIGELLGNCRRHAVPVFHIHTLIAADGGNRMPHWRQVGLWRCIEGTPGALPPTRLLPITGEPVFAKSFFSAFGNPGLLAALQRRELETLILAGVHTHACVRSTALDAYQAGFEVLIASDAVGSYDPEHAAITLDYLQGRAARCLPCNEIVELIGADNSSGEKYSAPTIWLHRLPADWDQVIAEVPLLDANAIDRACGKAARSQRSWAAFTKNERTGRLRRWLDQLTRRSSELTELLTLEIAKPRRDAEAELRFALALLEHTLTAVETGGDITSPGFAVSHRPRGVIALVTPWNNPLAIPVGKLAPALGYGNSVVWKPALQSYAISKLILDTLREAELGDYVELVTGGADSGRALVRNSGLAAISFTGSVNAGEEVASIGAKNGCYLQAELGGNNGMIVLADADPEQVARELAPAIFSFSGQRCTAPRRIIVEETLLPAVAEALVVHSRRLKIGLPADVDTAIGPLISRTQQEKILRLSAQAVDAGGQLLCGGRIPEAWSLGCWVEPTLVLDPPLDSVLVTEESFGPLAVLLRAQNLDHALRLCNDTHYGLVAGLFSNDPDHQRQFIARAEAGILLINQGRPAFDPAAPFSGWKRSGHGIPEHGRWDRDFYTRAQTLYR